MLQPGGDDVESVRIGLPDDLGPAHGTEFVRVHGLRRVFVGSAAQGGAQVGGLSELHFLGLKSEQGADVIDHFTATHGKSLTDALEVQAAAASGNAAACVAAATTTSSATSTAGGRSRRQSASGSDTLHPFQSIVQDFIRLADQLPVVCGADVPDAAIRNDGQAIRLAKGLQHLKRAGTDGKGDQAASLGAVVWQGKEGDAGIGGQKAQHITEHGLGKVVLLRCRTAQPGRFRLVLG